MGRSLIVWNPRVRRRQEVLNGCAHIPPYRLSQDELREREVQDAQPER
jgi:hypothetical protein